MKEINESLIEKDSLVTENMSIGGGSSGLIESSRDSGSSEVVRNIHIPTPFTSNIS
jgi:hypothetical protein